MKLSRRRFLVGTGVGLTAVLLSSSIAQATPNKILQGNFFKQQIYIESPTDVLSNTQINHCRISISKNGSLNLVGNNIMISYCYISCN